MASENLFPIRKAVNPDLPDYVKDQEIKEYNNLLAAYQAERERHRETISMNTQPFGGPGRMVVKFKFQEGASLHHLLRKYYNGVSIAPGIWEIDHLYDSPIDKLQPELLSFQREKSYDDLTPEEQAHLRQTVADPTYNRGEIQDMFNVNIDAVFTAYQLNQAEQ